MSDKEKPTKKVPKRRRNPQPSPQPINRDPSNLSCR